MSNYSSLRTNINNNVYENNTQQITGGILNTVLNDIVDSLGAGYQFAGVATLGMNPGAPDAKVFYLAGEGLYTNFNGLIVPQGKLGILIWNTSWTLRTIDGLGGGGANLTGYISVASTDDLPETGQATIGYLCGTNLYLYVGTGGDTADGKYQNCGSFRGPEGAYIQDIEQTETSHENGGRNTIKMTLSDGRSFYAYVHNGTTSSGLFPTLAALQAAYPTPVVGQYAFVGAGFPADIYVCTTAGTWTDSGDDYDGDNVDLTDYATKAEVNQLEAKVTELTDGVDLVVNTPKIINLSGGVGTIAPAPSNLAGWGYYDAECGEGSKITLSGNGGNYGLWGFVDANGYILSWSGTNARETNKEITAPSGTARVIVNTYSPGDYPAPKLISSTSLVGRINNLGSEVSETNKTLGQLLTEKSVSPVFVTNKYINGSGTIASASGYEYGSFDAESGDIIIVKFTLSAGSVSAISVANSDLSWISPKVIASVGNNEYQYLCTEDCKVVISGVTADLSYKVIHSRIDEQIQDSGLPVAIERVFPNFAINNGGYWSYSGSVSSLGGWKWTSGEFLKKGTVIFIYWDGLNNPYVSIVTEVDAQGIFIRSCLTTPNPNVAGYLKFVVDKDGYYSISNSISDIYKYEIVYFANGDLFFNPPLDHLFLPTQDGLPREILRSPSFVGIVHKWGFIGDSLSSGEQAVRKDGTSTIERFDLYDYSWGQRLCKLNSVDGFNFSVGGQTTKGWCNGIDERTWAGAQLQENWKEAYCIALGVNDRSALSPGDADTDINLSDYTQNADTFAGWYAGIIQRLRSVNPKCRIFCITIPYNNQQGYLDNNEVIRAIVPKFNRCYLVDLANYHWTPSGLALNDHLSPAGYEWAAFEINTYIDWIIRNNMDDFKDVAWVGTEYSA